MFSFLKKKKTVTVNDSLYAVASGELISIDQVNDPVFSQKMMGDGFAILPASGQIYSPVEGEVLSIFQTKHAIGFKMTNGLEILLHMGINTVELNGGPFEIKIKEGTKVTKDTQVASVDLEAIKTAGKGLDMVVVITNMDLLKEYQLTKTGQVVAGEEVGVAKV